MINKKGEQQLPSPVICREKPFNDVTKDITTLEEFDGNTLYLTYYVFDQKQEYVDPKSTKLKFEFIATLGSIMS